MSVQPLQNELLSLCHQSLRQPADPFFKRRGRGTTRFSPWNARMLFPMFRTIHDRKPGVQKGHFPGMYPDAARSLKANNHRRGKDARRGGQGELSRFGTFDKRRRFLL